MAKDKEKPTGPLPRGNIDFADPISDKGYQEFSQDIYDLMSKYRINHINMYWKHFPATEIKQSKIHTIN